MKKLTVQHLATAAAVGAVYAVLSIFGSVFGVTFGTVQCRFAEALCVLRLTRLHAPEAYAAWEADARKGSKGHGPMWPTGSRESGSGEGNR